MLTDFHSHILPDMDDGASNIEESLKLLTVLRDSGVQRVVLTSHFYRHDEDINSFLCRRENSFKKLTEAAKSLSGCPELILGAEVYFYPSLSADPDFEKLCIGNTDYVLLELPFEHFYDNFYSDLAKFMNRCHSKIILAHIERYLKFGNTQQEIDRLFSIGNFICQMNCTSIVSAGFFERRKLLSMISDGTISIIGTDTHNTTTRLPMLKEAREIIQKKCGKDAFEMLISNGDRILG